MASTIEQLRQLGLDLSDAMLESISNELNCDVQSLSATDLLLGLGMGDYDYDTGKWAARSNKVYAFDAEIFDVENMYSLFLQGVQSIVPDITITDVQEDLSGMTEEMTESENPDLPPSDGKRSVRFLCNGHEYSILLDSYGDWFNEKMFDFMDQVLEKENCPGRLYQFSAAGQYVIMIYSTEEKAQKLMPMIEMY